MDGWIAMLRRGGRRIYIDYQRSALIRSKGYLHVILSYLGKPGCYFEELEVLVGGVNEQI
jgi:hypothetical protein